jgi:hypothetical protein
VINTVLAAVTPLLRLPISGTKTKFGPGEKLQFLELAFPAEPFTLYFISKQFFAFKSLTDYKFQFFVSYKF